MTTHQPLLIDMAGIARLASVQRATVSMWRTRFASGTEAFPSPVTAEGGRPLFTADAVADWLINTSHGNNPDVVADLAASSSPEDFDIANPAHVATVDALLCLHAASDESLDALDATAIKDLASRLDPTDACLQAELTDTPDGWPQWTARLADAAYSPAGASRLLEQRHFAMAASRRVGSLLTPEAQGLLVSLCRGLTGGASALKLSGALAASLVEALVDAAGDECETLIARPDEPTEGRASRRRLLTVCGVVPRELGSEHDESLIIACLPSPSATSPAEMLQAIDELDLSMSADDRAVVLAPASLLVHSLTSDLNVARSAVLRSGRVRAIVALPAEMVTAAPRERLALWVLGPAADAHLSEQLTFVADIADSPLSTATAQDLTQDLLASLGSVQDQSSHSFRFARRVPTSSLIASSGSLVARAAAAVPESRSLELPALVDQAFHALGLDKPGQVPTPSIGTPLAPTTVDDLITRKNLRLLSGTRLSPDEFTDSGLVVVTTEDLDEPSRIGAHRVSQLTFASGHPSADLTSPGDVIFRTSPTVRAWVDVDGSKVVAYPARVLRIDPRDSGGLIPQVLAADIDGSPPGATAWRTQVARLVSPTELTPLRDALAEVMRRRDEFVERARALDSYAELLSSGVASGAVTLTATAAVAHKRN